MHVLLVCKFTWIEIYILIISQSAKILNGVHKEKKVFSVAENKK